MDARAGTLGAVADDSHPHDELPDALGPNAWLVDEMYEQYLADPSSVSESWQDFFADYRRDAAPQTVAAAAAPAGRRRGARAAPPPAAAAPRRRRAERRAAPRPPSRSASRSAGRPPASSTNMEASLEVPTATSFREVPAKLLEVNRRVINGYLGRTRGGKVSFTHLIGFAVVRAIARHGAGDELQLRRRTPTASPASSATSTSASASPSTWRRATAAARCSCPSSATPTRSTSAASGAPTRS